MLSTVDLCGEAVVIALESSYPSHPANWEEWISIKYTDKGVKGLDIKVEGYARSVSIIWYSSHARTHTDASLAWSWKAISMNRCH